MITQETTQPLFTKFGLSKPFEIIPLSDGHLHGTFSVKTAEGEFILQKLHPVVRAETCKDAKAITEHLNAHSVAAPIYLLTEDGNEYLSTDDGTWRMMKKLPGKTMETIENESQAYSAGAFLGTVNSTIRELNYECVGAIPHYRDTPHIYGEFKKVVADEKYKDKLADVNPLVEFILQEVPKQLLPEGLPRQIVHGDPKITNFLFDSDRVTALVDFDTCMNHTPLVDIGDALRSWCKGTSEDNPESAFRQDIYNAAVKGYQEKAGLSEKESALIPQAFRLITIELAMRFLKDYFEDSYFGWNPQRFTSRMDHNLARAKGQISLYRQIQHIA